MNESSEKSSYVPPDDHDWSQYLGPEDLKINATIEGWKKDPKLYADPEIQQMVRNWDDYIRTPKGADDPRWAVVEQLKYKRPKPVVAVDLMKQSRQRTEPLPQSESKKKGLFSKLFKRSVPEGMTDAEYDEVMKGFAEYGKLTDEEIMAMLEDMAKRKSLETKGIAQLMAERQKETPRGAYSQNKGSSEEKF